MAKSKAKETFITFHEHAREVTIRFLLVCGEIILLNNHAGGLYKTRTALCASLGISSSALNAYEKGQNVSTETLARVCQVHGVSGHWLLTGLGPRYYLAELAARVEILENRLMDVETKLGMNDIPKK